MISVISTCVVLLTFIEMASGCPTGWTLRIGAGMCFQFFEEIKSHGEAIDYCFSQDAVLATPKDAAEADFIANNVISMYGQYAWIGLVKRTSTEPWKYFDGSPLTPTQSSWNLWRSICPTNWFRSPLGSICYNWVDSSLTFLESEAACNGNGYDILMPRDPKEDMFLSWYLHKSHEFNKVWIGYCLQSAAFSWHSGVQTNFTSWESGEPNSHEDCAVYAKSAGNSVHKWYGLDCTLTAITYCQNTDFYTWELTTTVPTDHSTPLESTAVTEATTKTYTSQRALTSEAYETTSSTSPAYETTQNTDVTTTSITSTTTATTPPPETTTTTTTEFSTLAGTTVVYSATNQPGVQCGCFCLKNHTNITTEELESIISQIKSNLTVDTKTLSSAIRQLTSAHDPRVSSQNIGSVGIAVLASIGIFFLFLDFVPTNGCFWKKKMKVRIT